MKGELVVETTLDFDSVTVDGYVKDDCDSTP